MKTLKITRPALEASLPKYSCIQKLNFVIPIFDNIFEQAELCDLDQIRIFTAQYVSYRLQNPLDLNMSTYLSPITDHRLPTTTPAPAAATATATADTSPHQHIITTCPDPSGSPHPFIIQPVFYSIPKLPISHTRITRKMIIEALPTLTTDEKLNLILAVYDDITVSEADLNWLNKFISGFVRFVKRSRLKKDKAAQKLKE